MGAFFGLLLIAAATSVGDDVSLPLLEVETGNALHLVSDDGRKTVFVLSAASGTDAPLCGTLRVRDWKGRGPDLRVNSCSPVRMELPGPVSTGWYRADFFPEGGTKPSASTSFARLNRHERTALRPKPAFRMGFTTHLDRYGEADRKLMLDALVACGAGIVRCGSGSLSMKAVCPEAGCYEWSRADALISALRSRGIVINATVHPFAAWAAETNRAAICRRDRVEWAIGCLPPRPGIYRGFCRELAARYGTKIDYYEVGNEFDMIPAWILPKKEAVRLQREAWEGIKAGCPEACVTTCGWAVGDSEDLTPLRGKRLPNDGLAEYFLRESRPYFDVHAIHLHGPFEEFPARLKDHFFALREKCAVTQPWFANETADHGAGGRELSVARDVWRKIVYAWAHGSVDYTWYNLRGKTGKAGAGAENAYGVMTHDFHPRPSFAAFSALTAILGGLRFVEKREAEGRMVFRFEGGNVHVFVGWAMTAVDEADEKVSIGDGTCELSDLMGNRSPLASTDGRVTWNVTTDPTALIVKER